jgi:hypothetical protein
MRRSQGEHAVHPRASAWCARSQARAAKPPMLWQSNTGAMPVAAVTRRTASSMMSAYSSIEPITGSRFTAT